MPTYTYRCKDCGENLEVVRSFTDDALTECPACHGALRQVFKPAGIVFKGSGWHIKDYAGDRKGSSGGGDSSGGDSSSGGSSGDSSSGGSSNGTSPASSDGGSTSASPPSTTSSTTSSSSSGE